MITKGERGAVMFERGGWDGLGLWGSLSGRILVDGDKYLKLSVGGEKVLEKNETTTDFRL